MIRILLPAIALLPLACASAPPGDRDAAMLEAARALDRDFLAAYNRGDADAVADCYGDEADVVSYPPDQMQVRGRAAIREAARQGFLAMPGARLELTERHARAAGDVVIGWGLWRITLKGADGAPVVLVGRFTDVKAERNGRWVYLVDHASAPLPPPG